LDKGNKEPVLSEQEKKQKEDDEKLAKKKKIDELLHN